MSDVHEVLRRLDGILQYIDDVCKDCEFRKLKRRGHIVIEDACVWYQLRLAILMCKQEVRQIIDAYKRICGVIEDEHKEDV